MFTFILILSMVLPLAFFVAVVSSEPLRAKRKAKLRLDKAFAEKHAAVLMTNNGAQGPKLSSFSNHILSEFRKIPSNHRPFTSQELVESLEALDVKFGIAEVNRHFTIPGYSMFDDGAFTTNCNYVNNYYMRGGVTRTEKMRPHDCEYDEYREMLTAIQEVQKAVKAQEKALAISAVQPGLDAVKTLTDALHEQSDIVNTVTKDFL